MALTNFAALTAEEKTIWQRSFWKEARNLSFINQFAGKGDNSMVQRITELRKSEKGARAVMTLVNDLVGDGVAGDNTLENNEEELKSDEQVIRIDQLRNANRLKGRMADQKSIVNFREQSRDKLAYWMADRLDQLAFLTLSGIAYTKTNKGANRASATFSQLEFAADVTAPTANRHLRWDAAANDLDTGDTSAIVAADKISYKALVLAKAFANDNYVRGIRAKGNQEVYHVFVTPTVMAQLKLDPDYLANVRNAAPRSTSNPLFAGTTSVMVDGLIIHEFRHVFNTKRATAPNKWGAAGDVDGSRILICGAQALGLADIGLPYWDEEDFDYSNSPGIAIGKIFGFKKPVFYSTANESTEDFGVVTLDVAM